MALRSGLFSVIVRGGLDFWYPIKFPSNKESEFIEREIFHQFY